MIDKIPWENANWCFVGAQEPGGSRRDAIDAVKRFLRQSGEYSNEKPVGMLLEGVCAIGKTSVVKYAWDEAEISSNVKILYIELRDDRIGLELDRLEKFLDTHAQEKKVVVIEVKNDSNTLLSYLKEIQEKFDKQNLYIMIEIQSLTSELRQLISGSIKLFPDESEDCVVKIKPLSKELDEEYKCIELAWFIQGCPNKHTCPHRGNCPFSLERSYHILSDEELIKEIYRWSGAHPYALRIVSEAVMNYDSKEKFEVPYEKYIIKALYNKPPKTDRSYVEYRDEWINNLPEELEKAKEEFIQSSKEAVSAHIKLKDAGLIWKGKDDRGPNVIKLWQWTKIPRPPKPPPPHEKYLLQVTLEIVYWWWLTVYAPNSVRRNLNSKVDEFITEDPLNEIKIWFGDIPIESGNLDEKKKRELIYRASQASQKTPFSEKILMSEIRSFILKCLREDFKMRELQPFWQDYGDPSLSFDDLEKEYKHQYSIAEQLVDVALLRQKWPQLIIAMREPI